MTRSRSMARYCAIAIAAACMLAACGGPSTDEDVPGDAPRLVETVLSKVTTADGVDLKVSRIGSGAEDDSLSMSIVTHGDTGDVLAALNKTHGPLTMLELFKALAPNETPPAALVESHAGEAAGLARAEPALVKSVAMTSEIRQKAAEQACSFVGATGDRNTEAIGAQNTGQYLCVGLGFGSGPAGDRFGFGTPNRDRCIQKFLQQIVVGYCQEAGPITQTSLGYGRSDLDNKSGLNWGITTESPIAGKGVLRLLLTLPGKARRDTTQRAAIITFVPPTLTVTGQLYTAVR